MKGTLQTCGRKNVDGGKGNTVRTGSHAILSNLADEPTCLMEGCVYLPENQCLMLQEYSYMAEESSFMTQIFGPCLTEGARAPTCDYVPSYFFLGHLIGSAVLLWQTVACDWSAWRYCATSHDVARCSATRTTPSYWPACELIRFR